MCELKLKIFLFSSFLLFLTANFSFPYQRKINNSITQKQSIILDNQSSSPSENIQPSASDSTIKVIFESRQNPFIQQREDISLIENEIKSYKEDFQLLFYIIIGLNVILVILTISLLVFIKNNVWNINTKNKQSVEFSRSFSQLKEFLRQVDLISKRTNELSSNIINKLDTIQKFSQNIFEREQANITSSLTSQNQEKFNEKSKLFADSESLSSSKIINVKFAGERNSKLLLTRNNIAEYFYIRKVVDFWRLYVVDNILSKRPSQEYEGVLSKFFDIIKTTNPNRYKLTESALVDWEESSGEGFLIEKGTIEQVST